MKKSRCFYLTCAYTTFLIFQLLCFPFEASALLSGGALGGDRPRILVTTDTNRLAGASEGGPFEVDDHQSLVRFLLYSDMFDVEGIVHTTAVTKYGLVETVFQILDAYELDYPNLKGWSATYPTPSSLRDVTVQGATWAPRAPSGSRSNAGSQLIVEKANNGDPRPLWILVYGKITDVAQALYDDPTIKEKIRVIGSYQNFTTGGSKQPNDDIKAIEWIQEHHRDLYFIESLETLKSTAFTYSGFTYTDSNQFMEENVRGHGALGNHMWTFRKQDEHGNPVPYTGWLRLGDDPTLNYLLSGDIENPLVDHWGGRFEHANDPERPNYYKDLTPVAEAHASGQKFHSEWLDHFAKRLDRARPLNKLGNSDFQDGTTHWAFSPGTTVAWGKGHNGLSSTKTGKLTLSQGLTPKIEQTIPIDGSVTYTLSGWVKPVSVRNTTVDIWAYWKTPGGEIAKRVNPPLTSGNGAWAYVWQQMTAPQNATELRIAFSAGSGSGEFYVDDWAVVEGSLAPPGGRGVQLLSNGEFTNEMSNWASTGASVEWTTGHFGNSTKAGKLILRPDMYPSFSQTVDVTSEQTYTITAWVKPVGITGTTLKLWAFWQTPSGEVANSISSNFTGSSDGWTYIWNQLTAPLSSTSLRIVIGAGRGTGEAYIDDINVLGP
ncbi:MAG TPA: DUF1593 domain-containing protein [Nitrospirales bacterium]|nr:hypothetical protein [Nitrospiraceae bacterium]HNP27951.1 DUF1593 domain-containing protein [Nitrospirales bacterium]